MARFIDDRVLCRETGPAVSKKMLRKWAWVPIVLMLGGCTSTETPPSPAAFPSAASPESTAGSGQSPLSTAKEDYARQANAICQTILEKVAALPAPVSNDPSALADYSEKNVAIQSDGIKQLRALPPPPGDEATVDNFHAKLESGLAFARRYIEALRSGVADAEAARAANTLAIESNNKIAEANAAAIAYGLVVCGQS